MTRTARLRLTLTLAAAWLLLAAGPAAAHELGLTCKLNGRNLIVQAYFDDDTDARGAKVKLLNAGNVVAEGKTDTKGVWSFPRPRAGVYELVADAGGGHVAQRKVTVPDGEAPLPDDGPSISSRPASTGEAVVSDGESREDFVRVPWLNMLAGIAIIAAVAIGLLMVLQGRKPREGGEE